MRTVIFDLDGTLADTTCDLIVAANACFERMGHGAPIDPVADAPVALRGGRRLLGLGFSRVDVSAGEAEIDREYPLFLEAYEAGIDTHTTLYPGAIEATEALSAAGYAVGICTNKPDWLAEILMTRLGVRDRFASLVGAGTLDVRKPDPAPYREAVLRAGGQVERSVLIGDTVTDRDTARAAGVPVVLVTFGPDGDGVAALEPDALLGAYEDLPNVVSGLIG